MASPVKSRLLRDWGRGFGFGFAPGVGFRSFQAKGGGWQELSRGKAEAMGEQGHYAAADPAVATGQLHLKFLA